MEPNHTEMDYRTCFSSDVGRRVLAHLLIEAGLFELLQAFKQVLEYAKEESFSEITLEEVSVEEQMEHLRNRLRENGNMLLDEIFDKGSKTKMVLIATFLALLELIRLREVAAQQTKRFGEIRLFLLEGG